MSTYSKYVVVESGNKVIKAGKDRGELRDFCLKYCEENNTHPQVIIYEAVDRITWTRPSI